MDDKLLDDMSDEELLDILVPTCIEHSDYTVAESEGRRILRIMSAIQEGKGRVTVEDAKLHIKYLDQLDEVMMLYPGEYPLWLTELSRGVIDGRIKLSGGQCKRTNGVDLVGLFDELHNYFGFPKGKIYLALAKHLEKPGYDEPSDINGTTKGAESIRQDIGKLREQMSKWK